MNGEWSLFGKATCTACSAAIPTPVAERALLDEDGFAHVVCECGAENKVPLVERWPIDKTPNAPAHLMTPLVIWLVIAALLLLLLPAYRPVVLPKEPTPTIRLV